MADLTGPALALSDPVQPLIPLIVKKKDKINRKILNRAVRQGGALPVSREGGIRSWPVFYAIIKQQKAP